MGVVVPNILLTERGTLQWSSCKFSIGLDSNLVGLALSTSLRLLGDFQWGIRLSVEVENMMTSVERMQEYMQLTPEAAMTTMPDIKLEPDWPTRGEIRLTNACLQYTRTGRVVLRKVNLFIKSKQKVRLFFTIRNGLSLILWCLPYFVTRSVRLWKSLYNVDINQGTILMLKCLIYNEVFEIYT